jgi:hypothetical protein
MAIILRTILIHIHLHPLPDIFKPHHRNAVGARASNAICLPAPHSRKVHGTHAPRVKLKQWWTSNEDDVESEESPSWEYGKMPSRRFERGQTPGPPSVTPVSSRSRSILRHEKVG